MTPIIPVSELIGMPMLGFGTGIIEKHLTKECVFQAIQAGFTHIDCAHCYDNEVEVGQILGSLKNRKDIFITSKLWSTDHEPHRVMTALDLTLKNLRLDYLDMYLGWLLETWRAMTKLKESGKVKHVGVSNFTTIKLGWLMDENEAPANNQVELHPYLPQNKLVNFCKNNRIELTGYAPIGSPGTQTIHADTTKPEVPKLLEDPLIHKISDTHKVTPAQVLVKWGIQRGYPVLIRTTKRERMEENLQALNLKLSDDEIENINKIPTKHRYFYHEAICGPPHKVDEFWDGEYHN